MSEPITKLALVGAAGRMGTSLLENAADDDALEVAVAIVNPDSDVPETLGAQQVPTATDPAAVAEADVAVDFSVPVACIAAARACAAAGVGLVSGTTGLSERQREELDELAERIPLLYAANFSVGVNLLADLVGRAAGAIGEDADIEIFEAHHRHKVDAPSGTAKMLGRAAANAVGEDLEAVATWARHGHTGERTDDEIGFQVLRGGDITGEHTAYLCIAGERIELTHRAADRGIFARGALRAAKWLHTRPAGRYGMDDVLFGE